ncbi:hypothetical protein ACFV4F_00300 [Kitasatospora sp. NPDC059722]|uniref:hypothetical protein n=1 Tax=Kitasatospora sp. NPDC059722 TaxID=3346925 RepID=UPI00368CFA7B
MTPSAGLTRPGAVRTPGLRGGVVDPAAERFGRQLARPAAPAPAAAPPGSN